MAGCVRNCHCPEDGCHVLRNGRKERRGEERDQEIWRREGFRWLPPFSQGGGRWRGVVTGGLKEHAGLRGSRVGDGGVIGD